MAKDFQGLDHPDVGRGVKLPSVLTRGVMKGGCGVSMGGGKIVRDIIYIDPFLSPIVEEHDSPFKKSLDLPKKVTIAELPDVFSYPIRH